MRQSTEGSWGSVGFPFSLPQAAGLFVLEGEFGHQKNSFTSLPSWSQLCYTPPRVGTPPQFPVSPRATRRVQILFYLGYILTVWQGASKTVIQ